MNKHFSIEQLDKKPPFKVPEGYFESLTSRVMAQIPEVSADASEAEKPVMKPKTKVVGLMPHKTKRPWVKWAVAAAACLCGVGQLERRPNGGGATTHRKRCWHRPSALALKPVPTWCWLLARRRSQS